jgi:hypothetical protein
MSRTNEYMDSDDRLTEMTSLAECLEYLAEKGFTEQFRVEEGKLVASTDDNTYGPEQVKAVNFYRFEGNSNPDDTSILYAIETNDDRKGTLTDAYGMYADPEVGEFVQAMEIFKKTQLNPEH